MAPLSSLAPGLFFSNLRLFLIGFGLTTGLGFSGPFLICVRGAAGLTDGIEATSIITASVLVCSGASDNRFDDYFLLVGVNQTRVNKLIVYSPLLSYFLQSHLLSKSGSNLSNPLFSMTYNVTDDV